MTESHLVERRVPPMGKDKPDRGQPARTHARQDKPKSSRWHRAQKASVLRRVIPDGFCESSVAMEDGFPSME
jgi:hypothetical protein